MTAVLWIPPEPIRGHVTLMHPFVTRNQFREAKKKLRAMCEALPNFTVRLARLEYFEKTRTICVIPEPVEVFRKIHDELQAAFPICRSKHPFTPHLTLAHGPRDQKVPWEPVEVQANGIVLMRDVRRIERTFTFSERGY